jgi:predicted nucleic acid-binding protein
VFVLDASIALAWAFEDEESSEVTAVLTRLERESAIVPAIWPLEIGNALLAAERRGRISAVAVSRFLKLLERLAIRVDRAPEIFAMEPLLSIARDQSLSVYDASYLELATRTELPLATADQRLRAAARSTNVALAS